MVSTYASTVTVCNILLERKIGVNSAELQNGQRRASREDYARLPGRV